LLLPGGFGRPARWYFVLRAFTPCLPLLHLLPASIHAGFWVVLYDLPIIHHLHYHTISAEQCLPTAAPSLLPVAAAARIRWFLFACHRLFTCLPVFCPPAPSTTMQHHTSVVLATFVVLHLHVSVPAVLPLRPVACIGMVRRVATYLSLHGNNSLLWHYHCSRPVHFLMCLSLFLQV